MYVLFVGKFVVFNELKIFLILEMILLERKLDIIFIKKKGIFKSIFILLNRYVKIFIIIYIIYLFKIIFIVI